MIQKSFTRHLIRGPSELQSRLLYYLAFSHIPIIFATMPDRLISSATVLKLVLIYEK